MPSINFYSTEKHLNAKSIWSKQDPICIKQKAFLIPGYTLEPHTIPRNQGPKGHSRGMSWGKSTGQTLEIRDLVLDLQLTRSVIDSKPLNFSGLLFLHL